MFFFQNIHQFKITKENKIQIKNLDKNYLILQKVKKYF
jgi:hypothetical protein